MVFWGTTIYGERHHTACVLAHRGHDDPEKVWRWVGRCLLRGAADIWTCAFCMAKHEVLIHIFSLEVKHKTSATSKQMGKFADFGCCWSVPVKQKTTSCTMEAGANWVSKEGNLMLNHLFSIYPPVTWPSNGDQSPNLCYIYTLGALGFRRLSCLSLIQMSKITVAYQKSGYIYIYSYHFPHEDMTNTCGFIQHLPPTEESAYSARVTTAFPPGESQARPWRYWRVRHWAHHILFKTRL